MTLIRWCFKWDSGTYTAPNVAINVPHINVLVQDWSNSTPNVLELLQFVVSQRIMTYHLMLVGQQQVCWGINYSCHIMLLLCLLCHSVMWFSFVKQMTLHEMADKSRLFLFPVALWSLWANWYVYDLIMWNIVLHREILNCQIFTYIPSVHWFKMTWIDSIMSCVLHVHYFTHPVRMQAEISVCKIMVDTRIQIHFVPWAILLAILSAEHFVSSTLKWHHKGMVWYV